MSRLEVRGLRKSFGGVPVLRGVDLDVASGALVAVLGPSGCGKTTLLRLVAGFEVVDAGQVRLGGRLVADPRSNVPPERRGVGVVPQEGALFPHLSVRANVAFGLPTGRRSAGARQRRVDELLELLALTGLGGRAPADLSGGQQQRVALARALAPGPEVVLLDEPFSALDAGLRAAVRDDVRAALRAAGTTAVLVTHDQEEALSTADLVAVVRGGVVVQVGTPQQVYREPVDLEVARFVGEVVVLTAQVVRDGVAETPLGRLPLVHGTGAVGARGSVVVRPEQVRITSRGRGVGARVSGTVFYGHDATVHLELLAAGGPPVICRTQFPVPTGEDVGLLVAGPVTFFPR